MTTNDPISDMLTRIRNASAVKKSEVVFAFSKIKMTIAKILEKEGYIGKVEKIAMIKDEGKTMDDRIKNFDMIKILLKYQDGQAVIQNLKRISKPGRRIYKKKNELPVVLNRLGIAIISTPQGIMTNREAKKAGLGGEVLCEIY